MSNILLLILSIIGLLAIYWVLIGQWKWNKMLRESKEKIQQKENVKEEIKE